MSLTLISYLGKTILLNGSIYVKTMGKNGRFLSYVRSVQKLIHFR